VQHKDFSGQGSSLGFDMGASLPQLSARCPVFAVFQTRVCFLRWRKIVVVWSKNPSAGSRDTAACRLVAGDDLIWGK
jgi:hypothetical protein